MSIDCPGIPATRPCDVQHHPTARSHAQNTTTTTTRYCLSCSLSQPQTHDFAAAASATSDSDCCVTCGEHLADPAIIDLTDDDGFATAVGHAQHNTQQAMPSATPRLTPASRGQQHVSQFLVGKRKRNEHAKACQGIDVHVVNEAALAQQRKREWDANINQRHPPLPVPQPTNNTNNDDDEVGPLDRESKSTRAVVRIGARRYVVQSGTILKLTTGGYACAQH